MSSARHHLRFRQVHLDFHTSGAIPGVGAEFDRAAFQGALRVGRVNSVTLFSKCHHGWSYHPTTVGRVHPHLGFDLLAAQIEACREIGVRCPIYLSAGVDELMAMEHPEWVVRRRDGRTYDPLQAGWYKLLRWNSPYLDYLCAQIEEVARRWPDNDGLFLDITFPREDFSPASLAEMRAQGLDPARSADAAAHAQQTLALYYRRTTAAARCVRPDLPVFHNGGHVAVGARAFNLANSHLELESLPTGGWGYDHFALSARYAATQGLDYLGMTGKFHTSWGEFGGFKRAAALRYECGAMLAGGAKCSIGDQLHPCGRPDPDTFRLIGEAYAEVEAKEAWCDGVTSAARLALVSAEPNQAYARTHGKVAEADEGAARMLLELHLPFDLLDDQSPWDAYEAVVLPDALTLTPAVAARLRAFVARGGRVVAAGQALLDPATGAAAVDCGAEIGPRGPFDPDYLEPTELSPAVPVRAGVVIHGGARELTLRAGAAVLAQRHDSYFNRTWEHFCSHQHAPQAPGAGAPAAVTAGGVAYFAHDLFSAYRRYGQPLYRDYFRAALTHVWGPLPVVTSLPTTGRFNLLRQEAESRWVAHLNFAVIARRGADQTEPANPAVRAVELIEDLVPLRGVEVSLALPRPVRSVRLVPQGEPLDFAQEGARLRFTVPEVLSHQMVELAE